MSNKTVDYYNMNTQKYIEATFSVDMTALYEKFLPLIAKGGKILDVGCGSGRDSLFFIKNGYSVVALDAASNMCEQAAKRIGQPVLNMRIEEVDFKNMFDGIWACASLLHIAEANLPNVISKLVKALKSKGILYASWKYGCGEEIVDGKFYCNFSAEHIENIIRKNDELVLIKCWITKDAGLHKNRAIWVNILAQKL